MKYLIAEAEKGVGWPIPIVFDETITHKHVAQAIRKDHLKTISAGFVVWRPKEKIWIVPNLQSESLKMGPGPDDLLILNLFLKEGLSGLNLMNMMAYARIQARAKPEKV